MMEPPVIKQLDLNVVNRIAAGEIIQRPANALKELIENSLDAKSTSIKITIKSGGLKFLQIQDNGIGIRTQDLPIVCQRFTTSKLENFEDLSNIATYGFRGEALASISHIAHLTIQTKTCTDNCAYKAIYEDGKLKEIPKQCAGNQGTTITVEDLFFNLPQRLKTVKSSNEEFQKIFDIVGKYAIHNSHVGFTLRKINENVFHTPSKSTKIENITTIYGNEICKNILQIEHFDNNLKFNISALITDVNYSSRKGKYLIFVNHRLVESNVIKTMIEETYCTYLPKGSYPFIYLSLELEPSTVDVNVHPTKHEVKFLNEEEILNFIKNQIEIKLNSSNNARMIYKQKRISDATIENVEQKKRDENVQRLYAKDIIRTDCKEQKLEKFLTLSYNKESDCSLDEKNSSIKAIKITNENSYFNKKETKLTSILDMRRNIENACSTQLRRIFKEMVFVGVIDKTYSLFQFETKLYLCDTIAFSRELFYQLLVYNFQNFNKITFKTPIKINELAMIALLCKESGWTEEDGPKNLLADRVSKIIIDKAAIMDEYFKIKINNEGQLESIPVLLENYKPSMCFLPIYILRLATEVEWEQEEECFETFCRETSEYYSRISKTEILDKNYKWIVEHVIYPALRNNLLPSTTLKKHLFELTNLSNLYKVFERC